MRTYLKKALGIFSIFLVLSILIAFGISLITGEKDLIRFEKVDGNSELVRGIFPVVYWQLFIFIIVGFGYFLASPIHSFRLKHFGNFLFYLSFVEMFSIFMGNEANNDFKRSPKEFFRKVWLAIGSYFIIISTFFNFILLTDMENPSLIIVLLLIFVVSISFIFLPKKLYDYLSS